jgi:hypothetical protein
MRSLLKRSVRCLPIIIGICALTSIAPEAFAARRKTEKTDRCPGVTLPAKKGAPAFSPGEELAYELTVAGMYVGRFETKVGKTRTIDGKKWASFFGRARTNAFASTFKKFSGRYMTLAEPGSLMPAGLRVEASYGDDPRWEKAEFSDKQTKLVAKFLYQGKEGTRVYDKDDPLTDVLTMLYYARTRELIPGTESCQEVFGARWLWRLDAKVIGETTVDTPVGKKKAMQVTTRFTRSYHPDVRPNQPKFEMDIYFAQDQSQAPLKLEIRYDKVTAEGRLVRWSLEDHGEADWEL